MCGILGIINNNVSQHITNLNEASLLLKERGPDDYGVWNDEICALAHRRLSILDLSKAGHQPMVSSNGRYICTFNGEIYNFNELKEELLKENINIKFKSETDTEILVEGWSHWGEELLKKIDGMFAFAIWDKVKKNIYLARDRMGEKPIYYHHSNGLFVFASRPSAIFKILPSLSKDYCNQGLRYFIESGYVPAPYSIHNSIKKLTAASFIKFSFTGLEIKKYWSSDKIETNQEWLNRKEGDLLDELDEILSNSVKRRMFSDVPLGAFLSGGIDSSLVVAMMNKYTDHKVKTFTIGFNEKEYDESASALAVAKELDTDHYCENLRVNDLQSLMPKFFQYFDEPFFDSAAFPTLAVSSLAKKNVTVCLTGDGGDELFGGYHYYKIMRYLESINRYPKIIKESLSLASGILPFHSFKLLSRVLKLSDPSSSFAFMRGIAKDFNSIFSDEFNSNTKGLSDMFYEASLNFPKDLNFSEVAMRLDAKFTMNDDYLQKTDVASMAHSLESRTPFFSPDLIEWSYKLPQKYKFDGSKNKYLLRKLVYRYISKEIVDRPKRGFGVPIDQWLRTDLKQWALEIINDDQNYVGLPIIKNKVINLFNIHQKGVRNVHPLMWATLILLEFNKNQNL